MPTARILIVDSDALARRETAEALRHQGYSTLEACDTSCGYHEAASGGVDLMLLASELNGVPSYEWLSQLKRISPSLPVILVTSSHSEDASIRGLHAGADDCLAKTCSARELFAHVEAVLRRTFKVADDVAEVRLGRAKIDLNRREVTWSAHERGDLSETEAAVLKYLVAHRERAVSRDELLGRVWGIGTSGLATRAVDMHIARIRAKLRDPAGKKCEPCIVTVRSRGYMAGPGLAVSA